MSEENDGGDIVPAQSKLPGVIFESRCHVCTSPARKIIELQMAAGVPDTHIAQHLEAAGVSGVTRKSVRTHRLKHFTLKDDAVRRIIERRAREVIDDVDNTEDLLLTTKGTLEAMSHMGMKALITGESKMEARDLLTVLDKIEAIKKAEQSVAVEEMMRDYQAFARAVKATVPENLWKEIDKEFDRVLEEQKGMSLDKLVDLNLGELTV